MNINEALMACDEELNFELSDSFKVHRALGYIEGFASVSGNEDLLQCVSVMVSVVAKQHLLDRMAKQEVVTNVL